MYLENKQKIYSIQNQTSKLKQNCRSSNDDFHKVGGMWLFSVCACLHNELLIVSPLFISTFIRELESKGNCYNQHEM